MELDAWRASHFLESFNCLFTPVLNPKKQAKIYVYNKDPSYGRSMRCLCLWPLQSLLLSTIKISLYDRFGYFMLWIYLMSGC